VEIKWVISSLLSPAPSSEAVNEAVLLFQRIALSYLRTKVSSGKLQAHEFGIALDDLALDSIAELFAGVSDRRFPHLHSYFKSFPIETMSEPELFSATRRLVFSRVTEHLFRLYRQHDPHLGKIIRNIKLAINHSLSLSIERSNETLWIILSDEDAATSARPLMPPEIMESHLSAAATSGLSAGKLLNIFEEILRQTEHYRQRYPLVGLAIVLKHIYARMGEPPLELDYPTSRLTEEEITGFITESAEHVRHEMKTGYVEKGKITPQTYQTYFNAINEILRMQFLSSDGYDHTFYEVLRNHIRGLSYNDYRNEHRTYFEYLNKLVRRRFLEAVKKEL
jgi:hypothetical protein